MNQPNYYAILPAKIRYAEDLSPSQILMFGEITALADKTGWCKASNNYFAKLYKVDPSTVSRWVSGLKKGGYIEVGYAEKDGVKQRHMRPLMDHQGVLKKDQNGIEKTARGIEKSSKGVLQKAQGGIDKKIKYNNTSNNNTRENTKRAGAGEASPEEETSDTPTLDEDEVRQRLEEGETPREIIQSAGSPKELASVWFEALRQKNIHPTPFQRESNVNKISNWGPTKAKRIVWVAIDRGYKSLRESYLDDFEDDGTEAFDATGIANASAYREYQG